MAWTATDDFNGYSNGDLAGNNGGSGWAGAWSNNATNTVTVQGTTVYEGAKAVKTNNSSGVTDYRRVLSSAISTNGNVVYFAMSRSGISNSGDHSFIFRSSGGSRIAVKLDASQNLVLAGSTSVTLLSNYSFNTVYAIKLTLNVASQTATAAYSTTAFGGTGSWSTESSAVSMSGTGNIDQVNINDDQETGTNMLDYISGTAPFTVITSYTLNVDSASYSFTGNNVGLGRLYTLIVDAAQYIFSSVGVVLNFRGWMNQDKNTSSYVDQSKSNSDSWDNQSKS